MLHARLPVDRFTAASRLYREFAGAADAPIHRWLGRFDADADEWSGTGARGARVDSAVVEALVKASAALGVDPGVRDRLRGLADGRVRAVVTGQQPGVLGGPLMTAYKIAAAAALAREVEARRGQPCVPVFWMGSEDDDFAEVRALSVLGSDLSRLDVSVDAAAYRPGLRVGDLGGDAVRAVWGAVAGLVPAGEGARRLGEIASASADLAGAAAAVIVAATKGQVAVVDGREPALRTAARSLLLEYFDREDELRAAVDAEGHELAAAGYHAQLSSGSDSGLFLVRDGVRLRVPPERRAVARAEFAADINRVSPGVVARNLVQDAVLAPIAVVLGPAEIAYRAQLAPVYRAMHVASPVVMPRLSATYLPAPVAAMVRELGLAAEYGALQPAELVRTARAAAEDVAFKEAALAMEAAFAREAGVFSALAGDRLDARAKEKLERRLRDLAQRLSQALADAIAQDARGAESRWPFLSRLLDVFEKDATAQERFLSLAVPLLFHGDAAWEAISTMAGEWVGDALDRRVWHGVYSV